MQQADTRRTSAISIIPSIAPAADAAERDARRPQSASTPIPLTRTSARGRSRPAFVLPIRLCAAATGLATAAIALALYLRF